jgi:hypothetical protein
MQCDRMPSGVARVERRSSAVSSYGTSGSIWTMTSVCRGLVD